MTDRPEFDDEELNSLNPPSSINLAIFDEPIWDDKRDAAARTVVEYSQSVNAWRPFTYDEIQEFYTTQGNEGEFDFHGLDGAPDEGEFNLEKDAQGRYHVTYIFIVRCLNATDA